ncbi:pitrilysin family protein [Bdellovibrio sp. NC01]|uniref:M16 family metallopeptidase n=1 Tax=Bdellovibrio sp. NC01 TaxID=2220073 RepID=UPI00115882AC|nr:pitrilysin family protein [Bdellovibrio sp. NC01]QDK39533.1 insulinase family protein [Bdellovibrio sp. NC01]
MSKKFQLKNGLKVLLLPSHKSPVVSVQMWVKTGSADEKRGEEGISHFIEHLVFKGTRKYGVGEIASTVEGSGGELNAYTSFDQTVFYVTISKQFSDVAMDVISEMMGFPTFDKQEIDNEREVVIEEIKRGQDSPGRRASQLLFTNTFRKHEYGRPVIGFDKVVRGVSVKKIREYYQSRYVPSNMFLVIAGDFDVKDMKKKVETMFGGFAAFKLRKVKRTKEPVQAGIRVKVEEAKFESTTGYLTWRIPNVKHKDIAALEVMSAIFGQGDSSRLMKALRINEPLTNSVGSFSYSMQDDGLFSISFNLEKENLQAALTKMIPEIVRIIEEPPTPGEMQKAITNFASHEVYSMETVDNIARKAGGDEFYYGDHDHYRKYMKDVYSLKPEDIQKVAKKYFKSDAFGLSLLTNMEKKEAEKILKTFAKDLKKALTTSKAKKIAKPVKFTAKKFNINVGAVEHTPKTEKIQLKSGATLLIREQKDTPYVAMKAAFLGGVRVEDNNQEGLTEIFSRNWLSGSKNFTEDEINLRVDELAAGISAFGGRNSVGLSMDYLSPFEDKMFEIYKDALLYPQFPSTILEREKVVQKNQIKARQDNPAQLCVMAFMKEIFKGHPYSRDLLGTMDSIAGVTPEKLHAYYQKIAHANNLTFCVVGDVKTDKWVKELEELTAALPKGARIKNSFPAPVLKESKHLFQELKKEQSHIIVGYQGLTLDSPDRYALEIIQSILSGQGGRLFLELRDKNSLAYSVSPMHMEGIECGYFGGYIGCSPEKSNKAISMLKEEFNKLVTTKVGEDELTRAQRYLIGRHDIELQRKGTICNAILFDDIYGLDYKDSLDVADKYFAVTPEDVQRVAEKIFSQPSIVSLVGPNDIK